MSDAAQETILEETTGGDPVSETPPTEGAPRETPPTGGESAGDANGADPSGESPGEPAGWPADWRDRLADHFSGGDKEKRERELKRLERYTDIEAIYGSKRELEAQFNERGLVRKPGEDASEEEIAAYHKALGVPDSPDEYVDNLKLPNDETLGDQDMGIAKDFADFVHKRGYTPDQYNAGVEFFTKYAQQVQEQLASNDASFKEQSMQQLREDWGPNYQRNLNSLRVLFKDAPGGWDLKNPESLSYWINNARGPDQRTVADNPDFIKQMANWAQQIDPAATLTEDTPGDIRTIEQEYNDIRKLMREDRPAYNKDVAMQERFQELGAALRKLKERDAA